VLSYAGIHAVAQQGGLEARYARGYPLLIDALLIIVLAAVLALRGAGLPSRILSWLALLVLLSAAAAAEALHATGRTLPRDAAAITVAVLPWLLVLVTFVLLLAMLRHARLRRLASSARTRPAQHRQPAPPATPLPARARIRGTRRRLCPASARGWCRARPRVPPPAAAVGRESHGPQGGSAGPAGLAPPDESSLAAGPDARDAGESAGQREADEPGG